MYFDPYEVLGVSSNSSDDEIKKAYRSLSRKFHPDANINNPNKEQAEEKFKQVQQAYDTIMRQRSGGNDQSQGFGNGYGGFGGFGNFGYGQQRQSSQSQGPVEFQAAANYINAGHYQEALNVLNRLESTYRNAQWYFLRSIANNGLGNAVNAMEDAQTAVNLEPNNMQYRSFYQQLQNGGSSWYGNMGQGYGRGDVMGGDLCCQLCMLSLCCPCNGPC